MEVHKGMGNVLGVFAPSKTTVSGLRVVLRGD